MQQQIQRHHRKHRHDNVQAEICRATAFFAEPVRPGVFRTIKRLAVSTSRPAQALALVARGRLVSLGTLRTPPCAGFRFRNRPGGDVAIYWIACHVSRVAMRAAFRGAAVFLAHEVAAGVAACDGLFVAKTAAFHERFHDQ
jgi:hypothetical protein